ncbi:MAG TPA: hypothetical protein VFQ91_25900, partial [Bryobacteraceae bacterium]|nr:hypothetical protein [Bryobacteraceae bacterium]
MAISATISVKDGATPVLVEAARRLSPATVAKVAGREGQNFTRQHFIRLNAERPNELGGKRTNFYAQAARGTTHTADAKGATISVNQVGIRQRIQGGTILPKRAGGFLTIPARAEAHGKSAREFNNLKVLYGRGGQPVALVEADATRVKQTKKGFKSIGEIGGGVMYWLVKRVEQQPDPSVMPDLRAMGERIVAALAQL